jgi:Ni,Fe-hydrogenase III large subunit
MVHIADRICGICSFIHSMAYCQGIEALMKVEVPVRAHFLRTIWSELSRIHSHLLWLGLAADAFGFESLFMHSWRLREYILNIIEETTGGRVIFGACKVGGTRRDIPADTLASMGRRLQELRPEFHEVTDVFIRDYSVQHRLCGVGVLPQKDARELGTVGPMLRASGVAYDLRTRGYAAYGAVDFEPVVETDGDCYARCKVRVREVFSRSTLYAGNRKNSRRAGRCQSYQRAGRRIPFAGRTAARRSRSLCEGQRFKISCALQGSDSHLRQRRGDGPGDQGFASGRRAEYYSHR